MDRAELAVIGAGPYGLAVAAHARARGIDTVVFGAPMGFWRDSMPAQMLLRSGRDWHLDVAGVHTFEAFLDATSSELGGAEPISLGLLLDYTDWFVEQKALRIRPDMVDCVTTRPDGFALRLESGEQLLADAVVAAPGIARFVHLPEWASGVSPSLRRHTVEHVGFDDAAGLRYVIVGGRQSAYEWAALLAEHGAASVDVVHRHPVPRFAVADWRFVDPYMASTLAEPGWWRGLPQERRAEIGQEFWSVGRLTLEPWIPPRLDPGRVRSWPGREVANVADTDGALIVTLDDGSALGADQLVFATGFRADLTQISYLAGLLDRITAQNGYPVLDEAFGTSVPGLYATGFLATQDFGPFFGFMRGAIVSASIIVDDVGRRRPTHQALENF